MYINRGTCQGTCLRVVQAPGRCHPGKSSATEIGRWLKTNIKLLELAGRLQQDPSILELLVMPKDDPPFPARGPLAVAIKPDGRHVLANTVVPASLFALLAVCTLIGQFAPPEANFWEWQLFHTETFADDHPLKKHDVQDAAADGSLYTVGVGKADITGYKRCFQSRIRETNARTDRLWSSI